MAMLITGAIFDMDGTILDSSAMWETVEASILLELGYTPKPTLLEDVLPLGALDTAPFLKKDYRMKESAEEINAAIDRKIARYYRCDAQLKPGALEFLKALKSRGVRLALATATARRHALAALELTGALPLFDAVLSCEETGHTKYEPVIFLEALRLLGTDRHATWVFEDALYALRTARASGFPVCGVEDRSAWRQREEIQAEADCYLPSFEQWENVLSFAWPE